MGKLGCVQNIMSVMISLPGLSTLLRSWLVGVRMVLAGGFLYRTAKDQDVTIVSLSSVRKHGKGVGSNLALLVS